jgi:hypothetical protein
MIEAKSFLLDPVHPGGYHLVSNLRFVLTCV